MNRNVYIETYGCQMNLSDTEIVSSILKNNGYSMIESADSADVILLNTCSVRENAERKIFERLIHLKQYKKKKSSLVVGIIGCMAGRIQEKLVKGSDMVNLTAGPDDYRNLHELIDDALIKNKRNGSSFVLKKELDGRKQTADGRQEFVKLKSIVVSQQSSVFSRQSLDKMKDKFSNEIVIEEDSGEDTSFDELRRNLDNDFFNKKVKEDETYDDITPLRTDDISAWVSIMRGCNKFCSYCVVPYTRGRERSRPVDSILEEIRKLNEGAYREITLLGQNVNSYKCPETNSDFPDLLEKVAFEAPNIRFRFMTSHPQDISDKLIETIASQKNICNHIHFAMQSGSNNVLKKMNRKYTIEHFLEKVERIKSLIPNCSLTTDIIAGFPGETIEDHEATLKAMEIIMYDTAFMFRYSAREGTHAFRLNDDVPEEEKLRRLNEIIQLQQKISKMQNALEIDHIHEILVEGVSKKNKNEWYGRTDANKVVIFPFKEGISRGDLINIKIVRTTSATLIGEMV